MMTCFASSLSPMQCQTSTNTCLTYITRQYLDTSSAAVMYEMLISDHLVVSSEVIASVNSKRFQSGASVFIQSVKMRIRQYSPFSTHKSLCHCHTWCPRISRKSANTVQAHSKKWDVYGGGVYLRLFSYWNITITTLRSDTLFRLNHTPAWKPSLQRNPQILCWLYQSNDRDAAICNSLILFHAMYRQHSCVNIYQPRRCRRPETLSNNLNSPHSHIYSILQRYRPGCIMSTLCLNAYMWISSLWTRWDPRSDPDFGHNMRKAALTMRPMRPVAK